MTNFKKTLLVGTALVAVGGFSVGAQAAACATTGALAADCELQADTTGAITLDDGVDVTLDTDGVTIGHTVDHTALGASDSTIVTDGSGVTITQTADIGATLEIGSLTIAAGDTLVSQASIETALGTTIAGTLTIDAAGASVYTNDAGGIEIGATGVVTVADSTTGTVALGDAQGIDIAAGGVLTITDATGLTLAAVAGNAAGEGTVNFNDTFATTATLGAGAALAEVTVGAGETLTAGAAITATDITVGAGGSLDVAAQIVTGDVALGAAADLTVSGAGTVAGNITGTTGAETITVSGAAVSIGGAGAAINLGAGNDTVTFTAAGVIDADTLAGGTGTDTIVVNGAAAQIDSDITGFEVAEIKSAHTLTLNGDAAIASVEFEADGTVALATTKTLTGAVDNTTGADGAGTLTVASGATGSAVTGAVGATNSLKQVTVTGANAASFGSTVNADDMDIDAAATVTFNGDVTTANGLDLDNQDAVVVLADNVDWTGNIISTGGPSGTITFQGTSTFTGQIGLAAGTGADAINVSGADETVTITGDSFTVALTVAADSNLVLDGSTLVASGALTNNGSVTVEAGEGLTAATQAAGTGTYVVGVNKVGGAQSKATYTLTGGSWDLADDTVHFDVGATAQPLTTGASVLDNVFIGTGAATIAGATVTDNSYAYGFELVADGVNTDVTVTLENNPVTTASSSASAAVANVLLNDAVLSISTNAQILQLQGALAAAPTQDAMNTVLEAMIPDVSGGNVAGAVVVNNTSLGLTETRLASLRDGGMTGMAAGNMGEGVGMWGQVFGQTGEQDSRGGISGFDVDTVGFAVGVDTQNLMADTTVGLAFAYADTEVDSKNVNTEIDTYQITLYGSYDIDDTTWLTGQAAYAMGDNDVARTAIGGVAGLNAAGDFDSDTWSLRAELGRDYAMDNGMVLTPSVLANYMYYDGDDYTETGAGGASLVVDQDEVSIFELGVGLDASWLFQQADGSYVEPEVRVGYRYDFVGDEYETTNRFTAGGASFTTEGADVAQSTFNIGGAVTYYAVNNWEFTANYDFEVKEDYDAHSGYLRAAYKF